MIVLVKNNSDKDVSIPDLGGYTIQDQSSEDLLLTFQFTQLSVSDDLLTHIANKKLIINNGERDLSIAEAIRYLSLHKHLNPISPDGKEIVRSESRPPGTQTNFTTIGDDTTIHDGVEMLWDFSNSDDEITNDSDVDLFAPLPLNHKRKRIKVRFNDPIYIKEGTIYFHDAPKLARANMFIVCPAGEYYISRVTGDPTLATEPVNMSRYVSNYIFSGSCPMGDELNAETCQEIAIPTNYELWIEITVPNTDSTSYGWGMLELYRRRTSFHPGEQA